MGANLGVTRRSSTGQGLEGVCGCRAVAGIAITGLSHITMAQTGGEAIRRTNLE